MQPLGRQPDVVLDEHQVDQVLAEHWDELVDPVTPTTRILQLLDLPTAVSTITDRLDTC